MFFNIFVVGYDDDDDRVVVFNDLTDDEERAHIQCLQKSGNFVKSQLYF